jgi:hypothetical protein
MFNYINFNLLNKKNKPSKKVANKKDTLSKNVINKKILNEFIKNHIKKCYNLNEEWECPTCYANLENNLSIGSPYNCKHSFCFNCLNYFSKYKLESKCPLCRSNIKLKWLENPKINTFKYSYSNNNFYFAN